MDAKKKNQLKLATSAAIAFMALPATTALAQYGYPPPCPGSQGTYNPCHKDVTTEPIVCYGANSCRGLGVCRTATSSCNGQNSCRGQGIIFTSSEQTCLASGGSTASNQ